MCGVRVYAKAIIIPGDAKSIQEAVELAASGDEIVVNATEVEWVKRVIDQNGSTSHVVLGVSIENKDLSVIGKPKAGKTSILCLESSRLIEKNTMLYIKNGNITFKNFYLPYPFFSSQYYLLSIGSPIHVESGSLIIADSELNCSIECQGDLLISNSIIHGYSWVDDNIYIHHNFLDPAILFSSAAKSKLIITDSTITGNTQEGYLNVVIEYANNSEISLNKSTFIGGTYFAGYGSYLEGHIDGSDGISIKNCQDIVMNIDDCIFEGGEGNRAKAQRIPMLEGGGKGGDGLSIHDSTVKLHFDSNPSVFKGNNGGDGGVLFETFINAGNGGNGISLTNSIVTVFSDIQQPYQGFGW